VPQSPLGDCGTGRLWHRYLCTHERGTHVSAAAHAQGRKRRAGPRLLAADSEDEDGREEADTAGPGGGEASQPGHGRVAAQRAQRGAAAGAAAAARPRTRGVAKARARGGSCGCEGAPARPGAHPRQRLRRACAAAAVVGGGSSDPDLEDADVQLRPCALGASRGAASARVRLRSESPVRAGREGQRGASGGAGSGESSALQDSPARGARRARRPVFAALSDTPSNSSPEPGGRGGGPGAGAWQGRTRGSARKPFPASREASPCPEPAAPPRCARRAREAGPASGSEATPPPPPRAQREAELRSAAEPGPGSRRGRPRSLAKAHGPARAARARPRSGRSRLVDVGGPRSGSEASSGMDSFIASGDGSGEEADGPASEAVGARGVVTLTSSANDAAPNGVRHGGARVARAAAAEGAPGRPGGGLSDSEHEQPVRARPRSGGCAESGEGAAAAAARAAAGAAGAASGSEGEGGATRAHAGGPGGLEDAAHALPACVGGARRGPRRLDEGAGAEAGGGGGPARAGRGSPPGGEADQGRRAGLTDDVGPAPASVPRARRGPPRLGEGGDELASGSSPDPDRYPAPGCDAAHGAAGPGAERGDTQHGAAVGPGGEGPARDANVASAGQEGAGDGAAAGTAAARPRRRLRRRLDVQEGEAAAQLRARAAGAAAADAGPGAADDDAPAPGNVDAPQRQRPRRLRRAEELQPAAAATPAADARADTPARRPRRPRAAALTSAELRARTRQRVLGGGGGSEESSSGSGGTDEVAAAAAAMEEDEGAWEVVQSPGAWGRAEGAEAEGDAGERPGQGRADDINSGASSPDGAARAVNGALGLESDRRAPLRVP